jgi:hypothetical protein
VEVCTKSVCYDLNSTLNLSELNCACDKVCYRLTQNCACDKVCYRLTQKADFFLSGCVH